MGGGASAHIALSNPDQYDFVGILWAPLVDLKAFARDSAQSLQGFVLEELETAWRRPLARHCRSLAGTTTTIKTTDARARAPGITARTRHSDRRLGVRRDYHNWYRGPDGGRGGVFTE